MTNGQKKVFIALGILAGLVLSLLLYILVIKDGVLPNITTKQTTKNSVVTTTIRNTTSTTASRRPSTPTPPPSDTYLLQLARMFVERLSSYSNQDGNEHLEDVIALATSRMATWLKTQSKTQGTTYTGQTTRVITTELTSKEEAKATVTLGTQQEIRDGGAVTREYRTAKVNLIRVNATDWKVDGVYWE